MRGAVVRRARHWIANRGWGGFAREMVRRMRMAVRGDAAGERPSQADAGPHPFDRRYGVDTGGLLWGEQIAWGEAGRAASGREGALWATGYYGVAPSAFSGMMARLGLDWERYSFVDVGCGKGRALLLALGYPFREALGVELSPELAQVAAENLRRFDAWWRQHAVPARVSAEDATRFALPEGPLLLYLYHPFAAPVMRVFLRHVLQSLQAEPRECVLLYVNPELDRLVTEQDPRPERLWEEWFPLSEEDAGADRFGSRAERAVAYRWALVEEGVDEGA